MSDARSRGGEAGPSMPAPIRALADPAWYTPADLPPELAAHQREIDHLGVGCPGKVGVLELGLSPVAGVTRVFRHFQQLPLYVFHPLYPDRALPGMAFFYALQAGEGIVEGDRYRLDLDCAPGTMAHFTTQAATKIFRMDHNFASQVVNLTAGAGAFVEYLPDPVLPFRGSRFCQRMRVTADLEADVIIGEILLPGRVARGEAHAYAFYCADLEVLRPDGKLLFADRLKLAPGCASPRSPGLLGGYDVLATFYVVTTRAPIALADRLHHCLAMRPEVLAGVSALPNGCGVAVRALGHTSAAVTTAMRAIWNEARLALRGAPAPDLRKA